MGMRTGAQQGLLRPGESCLRMQRASHCAQGSSEGFLTKTPMDFSMKSSRLLLFLQSPAMQWMHSRIQMLEVMHVRSELRFWASGSPGISCNLNFALWQWSPFTSLLLRHNYISIPGTSCYSPTKFAMCRRLPHHLLWVYLELPEGMGNCISWKVLFGDDA